MNDIIAQTNGLLRKEHYLAGFTIDLDDHTQTVKRHGEIARTVDGQKMFYSFMTDPSLIYKDIEAIIETEKAVQIEASEVLSTMHGEYRKQYGGVR